MGSQCTSVKAKDMLHSLHAFSNQAFYIMNKQSIDWFYFTFTLDYGFHSAFSGINTATFVFPIMLLKVYAK